MSLAGLSANDWTALATVGAFLVVLGGLVSRVMSKRLDARRERRTLTRKTGAAVWGSPETEFDPAQPGLIRIVADLSTQVEHLAMQIDKQARDYEARIARLERGIPSS